MEIQRENKTISIGGGSVPPGKHRLVKIIIDGLPTGTLIDIPVYIFNAKTPGPSVLVQAGLHADEVNGVEIVRGLLRDGRFNVNVGVVIAVPVLNIFGFIHYSRDVPDGKDVNRSFLGTKSGSMDSRIAYIYLPQIDLAIDLHTGGGSDIIIPK